MFQKAPSTESFSPNYFHQLQFFSPPRNFPKKLFHYTCLKKCQGTVRKKTWSDIGIYIGIQYVFSIFVDEICDACVTRHISIATNSPWALRNLMRFVGKIQKWNHRRNVIRNVGGFSMGWCLSVKYFNFETFECHPKNHWTVWICILGCPAGTRT